MKTDVSIIIPVYNDERFLPDCINSAKKQTHKSIEIILVDDGSTDNSAKLCDLASKTDPRVTVIHKENGGLSSARNAGIEMAKGAYITFLDSDDYMASTFVETALTACRKAKADMAILKMAFVGEEDTQQTFDGDTDEREFLTSEMAIEESLYQKRFSCCAPGVLYKRSVIGDIRFPLGRISEDLAVYHLFLDKAKGIVYINTTGYYYRQRAKSIMHTFNARRLDALVWAREIEAFCKEKYPDILPAAQCRTFNVATHLILDMTSDDNSHFKEVWAELKRTRGSALRNRKARGRERAAAILSFGGPGMLRKIWNSKLAVRKDK